MLFSRIAPTLQGTSASICLSRSSDRWEPAISYCVTALVSACYGLGTLSCIQS
jgi:hypothetical protein